MKASSNIIAHVNAALNAASAYGQAINDIRKDLKGQLSPEQVKATLMEPIATYYKVELVAKERGEGMTWDKTCAKWETAKKAHQRICADVLGKTVNQSEELDVPAHIAKLAAQLVAACAEYEGANKLLATAVANAKAAK